MQNLLSKKINKSILLHIKSDTMIKTCGGIYLNKLEQLEQEAFENAVKVHNYYLGEENLKGIYIDGNIAINTSVDNGAEKDLCTCRRARTLSYDCWRYNRLIRSQEPKTGTAGKTLGI